ncbi:sulfatase-like hydrolase/transferase [Fulvivirgaceae bacterium BMA12]|uniref:Sulfatase-like hydrolase/transferase n=1 Tax=Agaribacillus aureus TaxID=3051825 RepID=A0ABT8KZX0_9BACT|nr:sulfatase-like hydrolase/transferase [Fulvivirgaceae bacterium BMA12]
MLKIKSYSLTKPAIYLYSLLAITMLNFCTENQSHNERVDDVQKPNIVLILTDDQGWGDLSSHGNKIIHTPNLDTLHTESVSFLNFYVSPVCAPTRASLLTGRYALRTGTSWVTHRKEVMRSEELTLAELLKSHGYKTGIFGKWHNGEQYPNDPLGQGFDEFFGFSAGHWNNYFNTTLRHNQEEVATSGYIADVLTDKALQFIEENQNTPFLCYLPYNTPHSPFQVPDSLYDKYKALGLNNKDACVYAMCENIDLNVGRVLDKLEALHLEENTIVLFLTDNGPNGHRYNGGMKGIKASVDEGGVRVPLFIRWPGKIPANTRIPTISAHIDLLPTIAEWCEIKLPQDLQLDGRSLVPLINGDADGWPDRRIYSYKPNKDLTRAGAVRDNNYRLVVDQNDNLYLFNMTEDPGQKNNVAEKEPEVAESLKRAFDNWFTDVTAQGVEPPPIPVGFDAAPEIELPAPEASIHGKLNFKGGMGWANDWITGWSSPLDTVSWELEVEEDGLYELAAQLNISDEMVGANIEARTNQKVIRHTVIQAFFSPNLSSHDRVDRGEVYEKNWKSVVIGNMDLEKGKQTLKINVNASQWNGKMELKGLRLKKVSKAG